MRVAPQGIDLWCTALDEVDESLLPRYRELLSAPELARMQRYHFERDRRRDLVARTLVRTVLSCYAPVAPREWVFESEAGRPRIAAPQGRTPLEFNLSHSGNLVVLAVSGHGVGVDVERLSRNNDTVRLERYFSPLERSQLLALAPGPRHRRFFELWTLKESYLKARGVGLRLPLEAFTFEFVGDLGLTLSLESRMEDSAERWRFWQFSPREDYLVAVCGAREGAPSLRVHEAVPLARQRAVPVSARGSEAQPAAGPAGQVEPGQGGR